MSLIEDIFLKEVLSYSLNTRLAQENHSHLLKRMMRTKVLLRSQFKRMIRVCPHQEYKENHLNTFFYDGFNNLEKHF